MPSTTTVGGGIGIAAHDALMANHVAVRVDRLVGAGDRSFRVEQWCQDLVVDDDRVERSAAGLGVVARNRGDRFADVADDGVGEHRLIVGDQPVGELARARRLR